MRIQYDKSEPDNATGFLFTDDERDELESFQEWLNDCGMQFKKMKLKLGAEKVMCLIVDTPQQTPTPVVEKVVETPKPKEEVKIQPVVHKVEEDDDDEPPVQIQPPEDDSEEEIQFTKKKDKKDKKKH